MPGTPLSRRRAGSSCASPVMVAKAPQGRHLDPHFAVHVRGEERGFDIACLELAAVLGSEGEQRPESHRLCHRCEGVVEVEALLHVLAADDNSSFVLFRFDVALFDGPTAMFDFEHPASGDGFGALALSAPLFAESAVLDVALLLAVHGVEPVRLGLECMASK